MIVIPPLPGSRAVRRDILNGVQASFADGLRLAGWMAVTLLAALGILALIFFVIGNFTLLGTMHHLDNLASRYVVADAGRQAQFNGLLLSALVLFATAIAFFRRASLLRILKRQETPNG